MVVCGLSVSYSKNDVFSDTTSFVVCHNLRPHRDRIELQDHDEQYRNDSTCIMSWSAFSTSFDVYIELSRSCMRISIKCGWFNLKSSKTGKTWVKSKEPDRKASCTCRRETMWRMDSIWMPWKGTLRNSKCVQILIQMKQSSMNNSSRLIVRTIKHILRKFYCKQ